jgi:hypothetical protein
METLYCRFCGVALPNNTHGNRRHCESGLCNISNAKARGRDKYAKQKVTLQQFKQSELTLSIGYKMYGNDYIPVNLLDNLGINWTFCNNRITIEGVEAKVVGSYAYITYKNKTMRIWKIS